MKPVATGFHELAGNCCCGHADIERYISDCCNIHRVVNTYIAQELRALGFDCPTPAGAFYNWPDLSPVADALGLATGAELVDTLLERYGVVALPGSAFGETETSMRLRLSGCDYDGAAALALLDDVGSAGLPVHIDTLAPNVVGAVARFTQLPRA